jgi:hypothetical protein
MTEQTPSGYRAARGQEASGRAIGFILFAFAGWGLLSGRTWARAAAITLALLPGRDRLTGLSPCRRAP